MVPFLLIIQRERRPVLSVGYAEVGDRTIWRIASENGWWCSSVKKKTRKASAPATAAHDDLVRREFAADGPNQLWVADLTEHRTAEGKLYCYAIKDMFSNQIVGWAIDERIKACRVVASLEMAAARRGDGAGCILHSDCGSQIRARKVHRALARNRMVGSMGNIGTAADDAAMKSVLLTAPEERVETPAAGTPATSTGSRSPPGSNSPTTGDDARSRPAV